MPHDRNAVEVANGSLRFREDGEVLHPAYYPWLYLFCLLGCIAFQTLLLLGLSRHERNAIAAWKAWQPAIGSKVQISPSTRCYNDLTMVTSYGGCREDYWSTEERLETVVQEIETEHLGRKYALCSMKRGDLRPAGNGLVTPAIEEKMHLRESCPDEALRVWIPLTGMADAESVPHTPWYIWCMTQAAYVNTALIGIFGFLILLTKTAEVRYRAPRTPDEIEKGAKLHGQYMKWQERERMDR